MSNTVFWADNETTPSHYDVGYSDSFEGVFTSIGTTSNTTLAHGAGDLDTWYKVRAVYPTGTSGWSLPFQSIAEPITDMCIVWGKLRDLDLRYPTVTTSVAEASILKMPGIRLPIGVTEGKITSSADAQGYFQLRLYRNVPVRLRVFDANYDEAVLVPSTSSIEFTDLSPIEYRG
jgi:hypothetical protein